MEHPHAELHRRLTGAFQSGDIDSVKDALAPGRAVARSRQPEVLGREAVLQQWAVRSGGSMEIAALGVLANDEHVIAVINVALASPTHRVDISMPARSVATSELADRCDGAAMVRTCDRSMITMGPPPKFNDRRRRLPGA